MNNFNAGAQFVKCKFYRVNTKTLIYFEIHTIMNLIDLAYYFRQKASFTLSKVVLLYK